MSTGISYLDETWNITTGCTPISEGCQNCWACRMSKRLAGNANVKHRDRYDNFKPTFWPERLEEPLKWKRPRVIGVSFMGDLFHERMLYKDIEQIWDVMFDCPQHTFIILTKRPEQMKDFYRWMKNTMHGRLDDENIWIGVSVENQLRADEHIPILLQIPAGHHFISIEPMLGTVNIKKASGVTFWDDPSAGIQWVINGCESGPGARPTEIDWTRSVRDQCVEAGIPFYLKQMRVNGRVHEMPLLDGTCWNQKPKFNQG